MGKVMNIKVKFINRPITFNLDSLSSFHVFRKCKSGIWNSNWKTFLICLRLCALTLWTTAPVWGNNGFPNVPRGEARWMDRNGNRDERTTVFIPTKTPAYCFLFKLPQPCLSFNCTFSMRRTVPYYWNWQGALTFESSFHDADSLPWYTN